MDNNKKEALTDILAEVITAPVALGVAAVKTKRQIENMPTKSGNTVGEEVENAANKVKTVATETAKKISETEAAQKVKDAVTDTVQKVVDSGALQSVKDAAIKAGDAVKDIAGKVKEGAEEAVADAGDVVEGIGSKVEEKVQDAKDELKGVDSKEPAAEVVEGEVVAEEPALKTE